MGKTIPSKKETRKNAHIPLFESFYDSRKRKTIKCLKNTTCPQTMFCLSLWEHHKERLSFKKNQYIPDILCTCTLKQPLLLPSGHGPCSSWCRLAFWRSSAGTGISDAHGPYLMLHLRECRWPWSLHHYHWGNVMTHSLALPTNTRQCLVKEKGHWHASRRLSETFWSMTFSISCLLLGNVQDSTPCETGIRLINAFEVTET